MVVKEKGKKHTCQSCGTLFYDLKRKPIICPKCGTKVEAQALLKPRRQITKMPKPNGEKIEATPAAQSHDVDLDVEAEAEAEVEVDEKDEDGLMEDMSDMGDDDEMSEVKERMSSNGDDKD